MKKNYLGFLVFFIGFLLISCGKIAESQQIIGHGYSGGMGVVVGNKLKFFQIRSSEWGEDENIEFILP
jgi:hypothetical protein